MKVGQERGDRSGLHNLILQVDMQMRQSLSPENKHDELFLRIVEDAQGFHLFERCQLIRKTKIVCSRYFHLLFLISGIKVINNDYERLLINSK